MIDWISDWAGGIIVAVIIGTIIEMILPEGNSKKYIKVVIGVYVLFTIISPVITKFTGKSIAVSNILSLDEYVEEAEKSAKMQNTIQESNAGNILSIYSEEIKNDMIAKIQSKGYEVNDIELEIADDESYSILSVDIDVSKSSDDGKTGEEESNNGDNEKDSSNTMKGEIEPVESVNKVEINIGENENEDSDGSKDSDAEIDNIDNEKSSNKGSERR